ncbi:hypothetical protein [Methanothrix sp.]|uniref:hypothetical protein n=1 Tax=Methanothrix sp. TaxID=90426 RepID=UPI00329773BC
MSLTDLQKEYLLKRDGADSATRSRYDFKMIQKLKGTLDSVQDARWIIKFLPWDRVKKVITDTQIFTMLEVVTMLMARMEYKKVRSIDGKNLIVFSEDEEGRLKIRPPSEVDLERARALYDHLYELERFMDIRLYERVSIPGYDRPLAHPGGLADAYEHQLRDELEEKNGKPESIRPLE